MVLKIGQCCLLLFYSKNNILAGNGWNRKVEFIGLQFYSNIIIGSAQLAQSFGIVLRFLEWAKDVC